MTCSYHFDKRSNKTSAICHLTIKLRKIHLRLQKRLLKQIIISLPDRQYHKAFNHCINTINPTVYSELTKIPQLLNCTCKNLEFKSTHTVCVTVSVNISTINCIYKFVVFNLRSIESSNVKYLIEFSYFLFDLIRDE